MSSLNPLDWFFGEKVETREIVDVARKTLKMYQFPGDEYTLMLTLEAYVVSRTRGPQWARGRKIDHWSVEWLAEPGIPVENDSAPYLSYREIIEDSTNWRAKAIVKIFKRVENARAEFGFVPLDK